MSNALEQIRQQCADEVDALSYFDDIPVLVEERKDLANQINIAAGVVRGEGGKIGAFCLFITESASVQGSSEFGPVFGSCRNAVQCVEHPELNQGELGTGKSAWDIACMIASALINFKPESAQGPVIMIDPAIEPILFKLPGKDGPNLPGWQVNFETAGSLAVVKAQIATPTIALDEDEESETFGKYILACATPGAAIFYTIDGKKPGTSKTLYTAPITVASGVTLKARGWLSGFLASEILTEVIP